MGLLDGKVAIITGSGRGIGRAAAELFAEEGAAVVINDLELAVADETAKAITAAGGRAAVCAGNVTNPEFPAKIVQTAINELGKLDILVNNAGYTWDAVVHKMTDEQWYAMIDVHATASFRMIRAAASHLRDAAKQDIARGKPVMRKIVNVMSIAGTMGNAGQANYSAAKAALGGLTKTIAREWGPFNINVNAVAFGFVETRLTQDKGLGEKFEGKIAIGIPKEQIQAFMNVIPLRRSALPREAAGGILFLASPLSDYVTGHILHVDGGIDM